MSARRIFHLSIPVADLLAGKRFYVDVLGATVGRENQEWLDILLWVIKFLFSTDPLMCCPQVPRESVIRGRPSVG